MKLGKLDENLKEKWKKLWQECKGSVYQSLEWAEIKEKCGNKPVFIIDEKLKAAILAFESSIITPFGKKKILTAEGTPLFTKKEDGIKILQKFKEFANKSYFYGTIAPTVINPCHEIFFAAGYKKVSNYTILINLDKSKEELWKQLEKKSVRWGAKVAERNNLLFEETNDEKEIKKFYTIYKKVAEEGGFTSEKEEFLLNFYKIGKIFLIKKNRWILGGGGIIINKDYTILSFTATNHKGKKLHAITFLYWNLIKISKEIGKKYFDLGGYDMEAHPGEKTYNINKFKERFGGTIIEQPIYSTNWKYPFFRKLMKKFKIIKKFYKK